MDKLNFSSPVSYRAGLVTSSALVVATVYDLLNADIIETNATLAMVLAGLSVILFIVGSLIKNLEFSDFANAGAALLLIGAGAVLALSPGSFDLANIWWFLAVFAASTMGYIFTISVIVIMLAFIFIPANSIEFGDSQTITFIIGTLSASLAGGLIASGGNLTRQSKKSDRSYSNQIDPEVLLASIADGIIVVDNENKIRVFNQAAAEVTGWSNNDVDSLDFHSVMKFVNSEGVALGENENPFARIIKGGGVVKDDNMLLKTRSDKQIDVSLIASPIRNDADKTIAVVGIFRDVTQAKHEAQQRAEFISTASHEMRTPVAAIEGYLALALNERVAKIDSKARDYLDKAHQSTQHLGKLFQDLLTAARSEDGRLTNHPQVVEVGTFLDEIVEGARFTAEKKGLLLEDETKGDNNDSRIETVRPLSYIYVDPERLREVITNLFDNAVKYTEEGKITMSLHTEDKEIVVSITDTGQGIPKEDIPHLFQKFYRVDNTATRQIGGTGLGLFISRKIVELYNGRIWAESEMNQGSTFSVAIPRLSAEQAQTLQRQLSATTTPGSAPPELPVLPTPEPAKPAVPSAQEVLNAAKTKVIDATGSQPPITVTAESKMEAAPAPPVVAPPKETG